MDAGFFLKQRTKFIRNFYDDSVKVFEDRKNRIEKGISPFDDPPYDESGEPPYLEEWLEADVGVQLVGRTCVSLLSDSVKLYFGTLKAYVIRFNFSDEKSAYKEGFVPAIKAALGQILETDWTDCPADFAIIEQVVLARNLSQHGAELTSFYLHFDTKTLLKHPKPFFARNIELEQQPTEAGQFVSLIVPGVSISRENLFSAVDHVENLSDYIDARHDKIEKWQHKQRSN